MLTSNPKGGAWRNLGRAAAVVAVGAALATPAQAVRFKLADGAIDGSFDTTIGWGLNMRTEKAESPTNSLYGNRSVAKFEVFSNTVKASHDFSLTGDKWGVFIRGNYFYDFDAEHETFAGSADNRLVHHGDVTDAYVYFRFGDDEQFNLRLGKQVISWGENTFIGFSINDINTVDITKLRVPGVELKDAFIGTPAAYLTWQINDAWSAEVFTLFAYDEIKVDPSGGFFLTGDSFGDGNQAFRDPVTGLCNAPDGGPMQFGNTICDAGDEIPSGGGQWGLAFRYYAADLGNGVDFGFYYQNLHDHVFKLGAIAGSAAGGGPEFFRWFPENIERWGVSWNTTVGSWAWGGEYGYRKNMKLQGDAAAIFGIGFGAAGGLDLLAAGEGDIRFLTPGTKYKKESVRDYGHHQLQMTFQRLWGPMPQLAGADQVNTIFEVVHGWVTSMPDNDEFDRFDESITNNWQAFKGRANLTYNNALFNRVNVTLNTVLNWDLRGYSPEFGGAKAFIEDRKSFTLGMDFDYKLRYKWGVSHTWFWGGTPSTNDIGDPRTGGPALGPGSTPGNGVRDRDFLAFHASYVF
jgi:hypothetical protein